MDPHGLAILVQQALQAAATLAGGNVVILPGDYPLASARLPVIRVAVPEGDGESRGPNGPPSFIKTDWLELRLQIDGTDPVAVYDQLLGTFAPQAKAAIMGLIVQPDPGRQFIQISRQSFAVDLRAAGERHLGEATLRFAFEYPEDWDWVPPDNLGEIDVMTGHQAVAGDGVGEQLQTIGAGVRIPLLPPDD